MGQPAHKGGSTRPRERGLKRGSDRLPRTTPTELSSREASSPEPGFSLWAATNDPNHLKERRQSSESLSESKSDRFQGPGDSRDDTQNKSSCSWKLIAAMVFIILGLPALVLTGFFLLSDQSARGTRYEYSALGHEEVKLANVQPIESARDEDLLCPGPDSYGVTIVLIHAPWCPGCRMYLPLYERMASRWRFFVNRKDMIMRSEMFERHVSWETFDKNYSIAKYADHVKFTAINCTAYWAMELCSRFEVDVYPTVAFIIKAPLAKKMSDLYRGLMRENELISMDKLNHVVWAEGKTFNCGGEAVELSVHKLAKGPPMSLDDYFIQLLQKTPLGLAVKYYGAPPSLLGPLRDLFKAPLDDDSSAAAVAGSPQNVETFKKRRQLQTAATALLKMQDAFAGYLFALSLWVPLAFGPEELGPAPRQALLMMNELVALGFVRVDSTAHTLCSHLRTLLMRKSKITRQVWVDFLNTMHADGLAAASSTVLSQTAWVLRQSDKPGKLKTCNNFLCAIWHLLHYTTVFWYQTWYPRVQGAHVVASTVTAENENADLSEEAGYEEWFSLVRLRPRSLQYTAAFLQDTIYLFVKFFMGCGLCRNHFAKEYPIDACARKAARDGVFKCDSRLCLKPLDSFKKHELGVLSAESAATVVWLIRYHNSVTVRIASMHKSLASYPAQDPRYPPRASCPQCYKTDSASVELRRAAIELYSNFTFSQKDMSFDWHADMDWAAVFEYFYQQYQY